MCTVLNSEFRYIGWPNYFRIILDCTNISPLIVTVFSAQYRVRKLFNVFLKLFLNLQKISDIPIFVVEIAFMVFLLLFNMF